MFKVLFGKNGGLTNRELEFMTQRNKFSDYLPWVAYDEETKVYLNKDNTVGFIWECSPLCFAGEKTASILEGLFSVGLPENSVMQFILYADKYIEPFVEAYRESKIRENKIAQTATERFSRYIIDGVNGLDNLLGIPMRNYRLFITAKMPQGSKDLNIQDIHAHIEERLRGASLYPVPLTPGGLLDWMRRFFNSYVPQNNGVYDETIPIGKQVIFSETEIQKNNSNIQIGDKIFRCITPKVFPKQVNLLQTNETLGGIWGMISDADQVKTPFMYTGNIIFHNLKSKLHAKCNLVLQQQGVGSFAPSLMRKKEEYLWATDEIEKGTKFLRVMPTFWAWGNEKSVTESITRAKRVWESQGYIMQEDRGILPILFISALPFGVYDTGANIENLDRDFIAPSDSVAHTLPVQADFCGGGKPVLVFAGRKGQVIGLDVFDPHASNHNILVAAPSGKGKSFFVNYLACNYFVNNALVRIIDIGGSYKKMVKMFNAKFLDFSEKSDVCLNPFTNVIDINQDLSVIAAIISQMVYSATDLIPVDTAETTMTLIKAAVKWAWGMESNNASIDTVFEYLTTFPKHASEYNFDCPDNEKCVEDFKLLAQTLAFNLAEFTTGHEYGKWFNGVATFDISRDEFVVLELEHLKARKELFKVVTSQVINAVTQDLYLSDRSRPRLIIFDEAYQFIKDGALLKVVIEEGYRRARKYGGSFSIITQSLLDLKAFGSIGDVIMSNSDFKFYLESTDFERAKHERLIDYDDFTMKLLKSLKTNKPKYSEIFMDTPFGTGIGRLAVDPYSYYMYTSDPREISEIESVVDRGMPYEDAINEMVSKYRR